MLEVFSAEAERLNYFLQALKEGEMEIKNEIPAWEAYRLYCEGKKETVQWFNAVTSEWRDLGNHEVFDVEDHKSGKFRLKPEPVKPFETWAVVWPDGMSETYTREEWAKKLAKERQGRVVLLREVINE